MSWPVPAYVAFIAMGGIFVTATRPRPATVSGGAMEHEKFDGERTLMRIHIRESDKWQDKPLHQAIVELCRKEGFYDVTVLRGAGGYGSASRYQTEKSLHLSQDLPMLIETVEYSDRVERILLQLDSMIGGGVITLEKVQMILFRSKK